MRGWPGLKKLVLHNVLPNDADSADANLIDAADADAPDKVIRLATAAEVVRGLEHEAQDGAALEDDAAAVDGAIRSGQVEDAKDEGQDSEDAKDKGQEDDEGQDSKKKGQDSEDAKDKGQDSEDSKKKDGSQTREGWVRRRPDERRPNFKFPQSRIVVEIDQGSGKYFQVLGAESTVAWIDRVLHFRYLAMKDEVRECYGADGVSTDSTLDLLRQNDRGTYVKGHLGKAIQWCFVFDARLQKRSKYYYFRHWASEDGKKYLWKKPDKFGWCEPIPVESAEGPFVIPRAAKPKFKTHCDEKFGGEVWFNVLCQIGGCPAEFVDAYNGVIDQRLEVAI